MDILIKNMEMPKEGRLVLAICPDGVVYEYFGDKNRYGEYRIDSAQKYLAKSPAVELPPHGRLVNIAPIVEKLKEMIEQVVNQAEKSNWRDGRVESHYTALKSALHLLEDAEVVAEAST